MPKRGPQTPGKPRHRGVLGKTMAKRTPSSRIIARGAQTKRGKQGWGNQGTGTPPAAPNTPPQDPPSSHTPYPESGKTP